MTAEKRTRDYTRWLAINQSLQKHGFALVNTTRIIAAKKEPPRDKHKSDPNPTSIIHQGTQFVNP
jgi:hypothetical protein